MCTVLKESLSSNDRRGFLSLSGDSPLSVVRIKLTMAVFQAYFDSSTATYHPNDLVTGRIVLRLSHTTTIRGIELMFRGCSSVKWLLEKTEKDADGVQTVIDIPYQSEELYFENKFFIYGDAYAGNILHTGEYTFNFTMQLPPNMPTSFESEFGNVRYAVTILSYPPVGNSSVMFPFKVTNPLDLNAEAQCKQPIKIMDEKTLCCWCCASYPISCSMFVPYSGCAIGHQIPLTVEVDNLSNRNAKGVIMTLIRVDTFTVVRPERASKTVENTVVELVLDAVPGRSSNTWERMLTIPDGPPSGLKHCSIINVQYFLKVKVLLPAPHVDLEIKSPVTIGNVALHSPVAAAAASDDVPLLDPRVPFIHTGNPPPYNSVIAPSAPAAPAVSSVSAGPMLVAPAPILNITFQQGHGTQPQSNVVRDYHGRY